MITGAIVRLSSLKLRCTPVYICSRCGKEARGSRVEIEPASTNPESIREAARAIQAANLPIEWAAYGRFEARCETCKG